MKQVNAFQTDDGQLFADEATARTHELDDAVQTIGGVTGDQLRNALHGDAGTKAIRTALVELGEEVTRQDNDPTSDVQGAQIGGTPNIVQIDNGHIGTTDGTKPAA